MPDDNAPWPHTTLRHLCDRAGEYGANAPALPYDPSLPRYVRITDIDEEGRLIPSSRASIRSEVAAPYLLELGDLLLARTGSVGKSYLYHESDGPCAHAGYLIRFKLNPTKCNFHYVSHWARSDYFWQQVLRATRQAVQGNINAVEYAHFVVPCPPLDVQGAIATVLDAADDAIGKTEALIAKLRAIKQGLLHDLLTRGLDDNGELRDPQRHPERFKETPLGRFPAAWDTPTINNLAIHVGSGITPTGGSNVYKHEGVLFIRSQNVTFNGLLLDDVAYIDERTHQMMTRSEIFAHDVLLNITGASIGRCCPMPEGLGRANVNQHVCAIRTAVPRREDAVVLSAMLASFIGQRQIDRLNAGSNRQGLNYQQLRSFLVPWPKADAERTAMAARIESADSRIRKEEVYLSKLKAIKKGLMQDLLTGRMRVKSEQVTGKQEAIR